MMAGFCTYDFVIPDLAFVGSPCNPFSTQRAKRFECGSVKEHCLFNVTDDSDSAVY